MSLADELLADLDEPEHDDFDEPPVKEEPIAEEFEEAVSDELMDIDVSVFYK